MKTLLQKFTERRPNQAITLDDLYNLIQDQTVDFHNARYLQYAEFYTCLSLTGEHIEIWAIGSNEDKLLGTVDNVTVYSNISDTPDKA